MGWVEDTRGRAVRREDLRDQTGVNESRPHQPTCSYGSPSLGESGLESAVGGGEARHRPLRSPGAVAHFQIRDLREKQWNRDSVGRPLEVAWEMQLHMTISIVWPILRLTPKY